MLLDGLKFLEASSFRVAACIHDHRCAAAHAEIAFTFEKDSYRKALSKLDEVKCRLDLREDAFAAGRSP